MDVFYNIIIPLYFLIGAVVIYLVFNKHLQEAEKSPDFNSSGACAMLLFLILLWPLAWVIEKRMK